MPRVRDGEKRERNGGNRELCRFVGRGKDQHGHEHAPDAVIDAVIRVRQKQGKDLHEKNGSEKRAGEEQPRLGTVLSDRVIERVDQQDGKGKRDEDTLIQRAHSEEIDELTDKSEPEHLQKIANSVLRIFRALRDHIGENGKGEPADIAENRILRKKLKPHMVTGHGDEGEDLQQIARKAAEKFCFHR